MLLSFQIYGENDTYDDDNDGDDDTYDDDNDGDHDT